MSEFSGLGKSLIFFGLIIVIAGLALLVMDKIPFIGKLPGDIYIKKEKFGFFFPITTSIIISIILSILFNLLSRK
ncbi:DUF2905 domain-containing protein [Candidatus Poribacteria bacterium]|nr:DUF2905 domain-containing protein [Candidatus Poribacteria bacterium]